MTRRCTIILDVLPPKECSPNAHCHWRTKAKAAQNYRAYVFFLAKQQAKGWVAPEKASMTLTFVCAQERPRDVDNWLRMNKSGQDGLVDAGILLKDDRAHLAVKDVRFEVDKKRAPQTIIEIEEALA